MRVVVRQLLRLTGSALVLLGWACTPVLPSLNTRPEDSQAPIDFYRSVGQSQKPCPHTVQLLRIGELPERPYDELSILSSTCSPGSPMLCDRILLERGCEHGADAVLLLPSKPGGTPLGASALSQISKSGRAVRFRPQVQQ